MAQRWHPFFFQLHSGKDNDAKKATDIAAAEIINDVSSRDEKRKGDSSGDICHFPFFE